MFSGGVASNFSVGTGATAQVNSGGVQSGGAVVRGGLEYMIGSAVGAFDLPARSALVPTLVPRVHLPNAISLNTIMLQTASVVGPSLGGLMIASAGVSLGSMLTATTLYCWPAAKESWRSASLSWCSETEQTFGHL